MIQVEQALELIDSHITALPTCELELSAALGHHLAIDISSPIHMPPFDQSAMDGYALCQDGKRIIEAGEAFEVSGEIKAGDDPSSIQLKPGQAYRIFTGAAVPTGANTVVQQEIIVRDGDTISLSQPLKHGANIRPKGEQISQDATAAVSGQQVTPAMIGFLAGLGITKINAYRKPRAAILVTGNELTRPGQPLPPGKIYESNSTMLEQALAQYGSKLSQCATVPDELPQTEDTIKQLIAEADILFISGGISVGDYDYVGKALKNLGIQEVFYKVRQKPGKPLFFGLLDSKPVFALPGNPAAALTCFYIYGTRAMDLMKGSRAPGPKSLQFSSKTSYTKKGARSQFLKARIDDSQVEIMGQQSSAMLGTFAASDCLVYLPENITQIEPGDLVKTYLIHSL